MRIFERWSRAYDVRTSLREAIIYETIGRRRPDVLPLLPDEAPVAARRSTWGCRCRRPCSPCEPPRWDDSLPGMSPLPGNERPRRADDPSIATNSGTDCGFRVRIFVLGHESRGGSCGRGPDDSGSQDPACGPPSRAQTRSRSGIWPTWSSWPASAPAEMFKIPRRREDRHRPREPKCDHPRMNDDGVSREHCELSVESDRVVLRRSGIDQRDLLQRRPRRPARAGGLATATRSPVARLDVDLEVHLSRLSGRGASSARCTNRQLRDGLTKLSLQPPVLHRSAGEGVRLRRPSQGAAGADLHRPRQLQADQRCTVTDTRRATSCCRSCRRC